MNRRGNGFGTLVSKGEGKPWLARWSYAGRIYTKSTGEIDRGRALRVLEKLTRPFREDTKIEVLRSLEAKVKSAEDLAQTKSSIKLSDIGDMYSKSLYAKDVTDGTLNIYLTYVSSLVEWLSENTTCKTTKDVKKSDAEAYLTDVADKICADNYNARLVFFKKLWRVFKVEGGLNENVWEEFKKMKA